MEYEELLVGALELFIESLSCRYPKQGTVEFQRTRVGADVRVGASEAHALVRPTLSNNRELVVRKLGLAPQIHGLALLWGNIFEDVHAELLQMELGMRFYKSPGNLKGPPGVSASPDGLGILRVRGRPVCVLYELKCPFSRVPAPPALKPEYLTQVLWGLGVLNYLVPPTRCDASSSLTFPLALFSEAVFRCCALSELDMSAQHNFDVHRDQMDSPPRALGVLLFYSSHPKLADLFGPGLVDFGQDRNLVQLLALPRHSFRFETCFIAKKLRNADSAQDQFYALANRKKAQGILCWKMYALHPRLVRAQSRFLETHSERVASLVRVVGELRGNESSLSDLRLVAGCVTLSPCVKPIDFVSADP